MINSLNIENYETIYSTVEHTLTLTKLKAFQLKYFSKEFLKRRKEFAQKVMVIAIALSTLDSTVCCSVRLGILFLVELAPFLHSWILKSSDNCPYL